MPNLLGVATADDLVTLGYSDFNETDVREVLKGAHVDAALDHWVVEDTAGTPVCWGFLIDDYGGTQVQLDVYLVRPHDETVRRSVCAALLERIAERGVERGHRTVEAGAGTVAGDEQYASTLRSLGFSATRLRSFARQQQCLSSVSAGQSTSHFA